MSESSTLGNQPASADNSQHDPVPRDPAALYQNGRPVARVADVEVDLEAKEVRFGEVFESDKLVIPEETDFREYRILIQRIAYATKIQKGEEHKGRVLRGVCCDLLGYHEK